MCDCQPATVYSLPIPPHPVPVYGDPDSRLRALFRASANGRHGDKAKRIVQRRNNGDLAQKPMLDRPAAFSSLPILFPASTRQILCPPPGA